MNSETYDELRRRSTDRAFAEIAEQQRAELERRQQAERVPITRSQANAVVLEELEKMKHEGRLMLMTDEEEAIIREFRKHKLAITKPTVFRWMTRPD